MLGKILKTLFLTGVVFQGSYAQNTDLYKSDVWVADQGDGTYKNPILHADYSDPDVVRVGNDYYMTASSFNCAPGLPVLHSKDMVNWELINYALREQIPVDHFKIPQHGNGVWAPSIRYHNNEIYIYWGDPDFGIYMVKTKDPFGKWDEPVLVMEAKGAIDPSPLWDDNGKAYLVHAWAGSRAGVKSLLTVHEMNSEGTKILDKGKHVFDGHDANPTVEGAKFYKRNGYYYIFAPAGGVATGWQLVLRSKDIFGPYEEKVVLEQGSTKINGPHQGAWVETPAGVSWFYHFQDVDAYGRIVHLQPMSWKNNWPVMGEDYDGNGVGEPVTKHKKPIVGETYPMVSPIETDEFSTDKLGLQWQWQANPNVLWSVQLRNTDYLRLFCRKVPEGSRNLWMVPNLLLQKFPANNFSATTKVKLFPEEAISGKSSGLIIMGMDYATLTIASDKDGFFIAQTEALEAINGNDEKIITKARIKSNQIYFKVTVRTPDATCRFSYSESGKKFKQIGKPFKAQPGKWIGAKVGLFSISTQKAKRGGYADFDWFRISE
ncbi:glycoside hydrolase family 43 protein [Galbibacter pacificus]|uniref:Glycoside hydrolase 43 family protein n=1 Tax=Galbibacter pacificus TaxID=2996052 RepID=A0ABT6FS64_9FLAO|nr:glycoside hydrolase 43 family protein [Galbibacter pacificus]MDG3582781.1 glycoside hydrolase 43 family protein [Galbibacter pacificus]MDG3586100.1 glycoside hydrolase 43 family protein [Galbibacter pacificus]